MQKTANFCHDFSKFVTFKLHSSKNELRLRYVTCDIEVTWKLHQKLRDMVNTALWSLIDDRPGEAAGGGRKTHKLERYSRVYVLEIYSHLGLEGVSCSFLECFKYHYI